jgi:hypothetical protein
MAEQGSNLAGATRAGSRKQQRHIPSACLWLLLLVPLLAGCGSVSVGSDFSLFGLLGSGGISRTFFGSSNDRLRSDPFRVGDGRTIAVDYDVARKNGHLYITVEPYGLLTGDDLRRVHVTQSGSGRIEVPISRAGSYLVGVSLWGFGGDLDIHWTVID